MDESEREEITKKFQNMVVVGYNRPDGISNIIRTSDKQKSNELVQSFLERLSDKNEEQEKLKKLLLNNNELEFFGLHPLNKYISYISGENTSNYNKQEVVNFLSQRYKEVTVDNLDELIEQGTFKSVNAIIPLYEEMLKLYQAYKGEIKPYTDYVEKCNEIKLLLEIKYTKKLIEELKDLYTESEYRKIEQAEDYYAIKDVSKKTKNYIGYSFGATPLIEAFSDKSDNLLLNGSEWQQNSIKIDRIQYFKNLGLDLGDYYESYLTNPQAQALIPSKELVERILNTNNKFYESMMNEYYASIPEYKENRARIDEQGLLDKDDGYDASAYQNSGNQISTNLKQVNGKYIEYPILLIYAGGLSEYLDATLIHELNHVYELHLQYLDGNSYQMVCGWDILCGKINNQMLKEVSLQARCEK